eukprot:TRINITY_DN54792_c0_g1_i2.p1 TRINITY_DN54792_c0_g1~~TRINITY_DN54792_c0_g1_i2.p1  ORF type:complete len:105 (+),score=0.89 TRINITY_DN54792_c0_g1_i2:225-539(+)
MSNLISQALLGSYCRVFLSKGTRQLQRSRICQTAETLDATTPLIAQANNNIQAGGYFDINLQLPPFSVAQAHLSTLDERTPDGKFLYVFNTSLIKDPECQLPDR